MECVIYYYGRSVLGGAHISYRDMCSEIFGACILWKCRRCRCLSCSSVATCYGLWAEGGVTGFNVVLAWLCLCH